jgi:translation initiation factor eIF-2B subunit delta
LCERIDTFIRERIVFAGQVIQELAIDKINDGDVLLTYARYDFSYHFMLDKLFIHAQLRSSSVEKTLLAAKETGKIFSVVVIDSRPLLEGEYISLVYSTSVEGYL